MVVEKFVFKTLFSFNRNGVYFRPVIEARVYEQLISLV